MTGVEQTNQLQVIARYSDQTTNDVASKTSWTSYRVSNPNIVRVDPDGRVSALASGTAYITAVNEGADAVVRVSVLLDTNVTRLIGQVQAPNGASVAGAKVKMHFLRTASMSSRFTQSRPAFLDCSESSSNVSKAA